MSHRRRRKNYKNGGDRGFLDRRVASTLLGKIKRCEMDEKEMNGKNQGQFKDVISIKHCDYQMFLIDSTSVEK